MDEKNINISKSEEELLEIMENRSHIAADQLHNLKEDEECLQACADLAEVVIEMQKEQNMLAVDVRKELADFRNKYSKNDRRKYIRILWASVTGVAATVVIILVLRAMMISSQPEIIKVFQADHIAQEVTLQVNDEKEIKPLKEVVESLSSSSTTQLSSKEIDYSRALLQTEVKEVGKQKVQIHRLNIPRGETFKVVLSEGTEVFLNSDSRLAYPTVFKGKERVVSLEGEAYFKVAKDTEHPFIVKSGNLQVRVLGTEFNVRSYSPTDVRVTLITGKVAVSDTCGVHSVEMRPGQSAQLSSNGTLVVDEVDIESFLYWKEGFFYFDDVALVDMMKEIGRWYNIDIEFRSSKIMDLRMHFFANRHQDIYHLIELLNRMERVHAYFETGKLIIE